MNVRWEKDAAIRIGRRLASERLARNERQVDLARRAGVSIGALRRIESDGSSTVDTMLRVMSALGMQKEIDRICLPASREIPSPMAILDGSERNRPRMRARPRQTVVREGLPWKDGAG